MDWSQGRSARVWMQSETQRLSEFVHDEFSGNDDNPLAADGGVFSNELAQHLSKEQLLILHSEFFLSKP